MTTPKKQKRKFDLSSGHYATPIYRKKVGCERTRTQIQRQETSEAARTLEMSTCGRRLYEIMSAISESGGQQRIQAGLSDNILPARFSLTPDLGQCRAYFKRFAPKNGPNVHNSKDSNDMPASATFAINWRKQGFGAHYRVDRDMRSRQVTVKPATRRSQFSWALSLLSGIRLGWFVGILVFQIC